MLYIQYYQSLVKKILKYNENFFGFLLYLCYNDSNYNISFYMHI